MKSSGIEAGRLAVSRVWSRWAPASADGGEVGSVAKGKIELTLIPMGLK